MFERFTDRARRVLLEGQQESVENRHGFLGTEHILIGLLRVEEGLAFEVLTEHGVTLEPLREKVAARITEFVDPLRHEVSSKDALAAIGIDIDSVRTRLENTFGPGALPDPAAIPPFTSKAKDALERALRRALALRHRYIGTEHELLGVLDVRDGLGCSALLDLGVDLDELDANVVARAAPDEARANAAWTASIQLQRRVQELGAPQRDAAREALETLTRVRSEALRIEHEKVRAAAIEAADALERAIADARRDLAELGIDT